MGTPWENAAPIALAAAAVAAVILASCTAPPPPTPTEDITIWQPRGQWSGRGFQQTDPFISTTGLLRVTWETRTSRRSSPGNSSRAEADTPATFRVVLHSDVSGRSLTPVVEHTGAGRGMKYISEDPRSFFFVIESKGVEWQVDVAEGIAATRKEITGALR